MIKRPLSVLLALLLLVPCAARAEQAPDPVVVRVGDVTYRQSEVQAYWDSLVETAIANGEDASALMNDGASIVESYVGMGIIENKLKEFGLDALSPADRVALEAEAERIYGYALEIYTQQVMNQYNRTHEEAEPYARTFMELDGYTLTEARDQALRNLKEERILEQVAGDVAPLTDAELDRYYEQNLVAPSREAYANDREAFERDVLLHGGITYYVPEGYRHIRHIFFKASDETRANAAKLEEELLTARADLATAENKLYAARLLVENINAAEDALREAEALCNDLQTQLNAIYAETLELYAEQIAQVQARLQAGESFEILRKEYTQDDLMPEEGFMISAESVLWEKTLQSAAMAMTVIGEVSQPVVAPSGVHILEYTANVPGGDTPLAGELKENVAEAALLDRKYSVLTAFVQRWRSEYQIETHPALLSKPQRQLE